jgi:hypothetical protein
VIVTLSVARGIRKLPHTVAEDLLEIIMRRYERASTLHVKSAGGRLGQAARRHRRRYRAAGSALTSLLLKCGPRSWRTKVQTDLRTERRRTRTHWSRPPERIAGFALSINCRSSDVHRGSQAILPGELLFEFVQTGWRCELSDHGYPPSLSLCVAEWLRRPVLYPTEGRGLVPS